MCPHTRSPRGFTLIEILITLGVLAMIMLGLVSALAAFGKSATRIDAQVQRVDEVRLVSAFLRSILSRSSSAYFERDGASARTALFDGGRQQLRWLGVMPARHGVGGLYAFHLYAAESPTLGLALHLQYRPYAGEALDQGWDRAATRILVDGLSGLDFSYLGPGPEAAWQDHWRDQPRGPDLVGIALRAGERSWPALVVRRLSTDMTEVGVRIVHGPGG